jgi:hypothetical protein
MCQNHTVLKTQFKKSFAIEELTLGHRYKQKGEVRFERLAHKNAIRYETKGPLDFLTTLRTPLKRISPKQRPLVLGIPTAEHLCIYLNFLMLPMGAK